MFKIFRAFYPQFKPYRWIYLIGVISLIMINLLAYIIPFGVRYIFDVIFPFIHESGMQERLIYTCLIMVLLIAARTVFMYVMIYTFWHTGISITRDLRYLLYEKLQRLGFDFYNKARTGDLMSRLTGDLELLRNFYAFVVEHRLQILLYAGIVMVLLLVTDWRLTLIAYLFVPFVVMVILRFGRKIRTAVIQRQTQAGVLNSVLQENITGIRLVKAYAMEESEINKFDRENQKMYDFNLKVSLLQVYLHPILVGASGAGSLLILLIGGYRVIHGEMSIGTLMAFFSYLAITNWPLMMLAPNTNQLYQAEGAAERILEIFNQEEEVKNTGRLIVPLKGEICFENVTFGYDPEKPALRNISFTIKPGEKVAIFGLTGSGKSTLVSLIPRFYTPQSGRILLDGIDIRDYELTCLRRQIGAVLQETFLFSATIRENIAFGSTGANMDEIIAVAKSAQIHDFIMSMPQGYDSLVGERGLGLSGGQKQRIAIARALLGNPVILILDDCTSSVDPETESAIQESLQDLMRGRTTLIIAQRVSTLRLADRIIVLDEGEIADYGCHAELMATSELYREIYKSQLPGGREEPSGILA